MLIKKLYLPVQSFRQRNVIGIHSRNIFTTSMMQTVVQSSTHAFSRSSQQADSGIARGKILDEKCGLVRRAIVNNDKFKILKGLRQDALNRCRNER